MSDVQFDEGHISNLPEYQGGGSTGEAKGMVGWLVRVSGGKLTPQTANIVLAALGVGMIILSIIIVWSQ